MLKFISDPHLGRNAVSHTTPDSRERLNLRIDEALFGQLQDQSIPVVLAGDLFHKANNTEAVIARGLEAAQRCEVVLAGNHDLTNRANSESSLQLLSKIPSLSDTLIISDISTPCITRRIINNVDITFIPHCTNQDMFDKALSSASEILEGHILCLHCNVHCGFAEDNNSALNLSKAQITSLLEKYKYIVVGHEHNHRFEYDGRLLVLGNLHPTSFADISDKFAWAYSAESDQWAPIPTWQKDKHYAQVTYDQFVNSEVDLTDRQFVEIVGHLNSTEQTRELAEAMRKTWADCPELLMLRNATTIETLQANGGDLAGVGDNLIEVINEAVKGTEIESTWASYRENYNAKTIGNNSF